MLIEEQRETPEIVHRPVLLPMGRLMYLSRLILNPRSRQVRSELADLYEMHRTVMQSFAGRLEDDERVLFRVDVHPKTGIPTLLVQSRHEPAWDFLRAPGKNYLLPPDDLPQNIENPAVKTVELGFRPGQTLAFRLRATPSVKKKREDQKQGRRLGLLREEEQLDWLGRKLQAAGCVLLSSQVCNDGWAVGEKKKEDKRPMRLLSVQFDGALRVMDPSALQNALQAGIGSGKGLGFGLLSLAPMR